MTTGWNTARRGLSTNDPSAVRTAAARSSDEARDRSIAVPGTQIPAMSGCPSWKSSMICAHRRVRRRPVKQSAATNCRASTRSPPSISRPARARAFATAALRRSMLRLMRSLIALNISSRFFRKKRYREGASGGTETDCLRSSRPVKDVRPRSSRGSSCRVQKTAENKSGVRTHRTSSALSLVLIDIMPAAKL
jgi:hypothetical protein